MLGAGVWSTVTPRPVWRGTLPLHKRCPGSGTQVRAVDTLSSIHCSWYGQSGLEHPTSGPDCAVGVEWT